MPEGGLAVAVGSPPDLRVRLKAGLSLPRRLGIAGGAALVVVPLLATLGQAPPPMLLWNGSASTPRGLYRVLPGEAPARGDYAVARLAPAFRELAAARHYLPAGVPLVKRVAGVAGDVVCARGASLAINGRSVAVRRARDALGRPLPTWSGCLRLGTDGLLLLGESDWSFDGRYFGSTRRGDVIGRARLLWRA